MNRHIINILSVAAILFGALSCGKEIEPAEVKGGDPDALVFKCSFTETRTSYDGATSVSWSKGDVVKVFDAAGASDSFTIDSQCNDFEFVTKKLGDGPYYSVAGPKGVVDAVAFNPDEKRMTFPMGSDFDGSFASADVLVSVTSDTELYYHHVLGFIEFSLSKARKVEFTGAKACAESLSLTFDSEGKWSIEPEKTSDKITVNASAGGTCYFPVIPQTYSDGFSFKVMDSDKVVFEKSTSKSNTVQAGQVLAAGLLGSEYEVDDDGRATVKTSEQGYVEVYYANKKNSKCVILYPGGGYAVHHAGGIASVIEDFRGSDVTLIVDYFTLPNKGLLRDQSLADANAALDLAWKNKDLWGGYEKVGLIGNSAGGHLAGYIGQTRHEDVDFQILIYPVVTLTPGKTHEGTLLYWLGSNPTEQEIDKYCNEKHVSLETPPTYLSYSTGDNTVPQQYNGKAMGEALRAIGHPNYEVHVYNDNSHATGTWPDWPEALFKWLDKLDDPVKPPVEKTIATAEQFKEFLANAKDAMASDQYKLTADINLSGSSYASAETFSGIFDGQNHKISGINAEGPMFKNLSGVVKNLTLEGNASIPADAVTFGVLAAESASATVTNVVNRVNVSMADGSGSTSLTNAGNLIGLAGSTTLTDCVNYGKLTIKASACAAEAAPSGLFGGYSGITGSLIGSTLSNCDNHGEVFVKFDDHKTGNYMSVCGVAGYICGGEVTSCDNDAPVTFSISSSNVNQGVIVAGVAGFNNSSAKISKCVNSGAITFDAPKYPSKHLWLAGVVGSTNGAVTGCDNSGKIKANCANGNTMDVAGIAGQMYNTISDCGNTGALEVNVGVANNIQVGGIAGIANNTVDKCSNNASVTYVGTKGGKVYVCGVLGFNNSGEVTNLENGSDGDVSITCGTVANCWCGGAFSGFWKSGGNVKNAGDLTVKIDTHTGNFLAGGAVGFAINSGTVISGEISNSGKVTVTLGSLGNKNASAVGGAMAARWSAVSMKATLVNTGSATCNLADVYVTDQTMKVI